MIEIDRNRLHGRLETFAAIGATRKGGVNRQALTDGDRQARRLLAKLAASPSSRTRRPIFSCAAKAGIRNFRRW